VGRHYLWLEVTVNGLSEGRWHELHEPRAILADLAIRRGC
jgi:hypothetical protein